MPEKISPFIDAKYGWGLGESGWNLGMDENLLKFSFLFNSIVDDIVTSLPSPTNGQAYLLTPDNRFYFSVSNTWYSTPVPDNYSFKVKSSNITYKFQNQQLVLIPDINEINQDLDSVELQVELLKTAEEILGTVQGSGKIGYSSQETYPDNSLGSQFSIIVRENDRHIFRYLTADQQKDALTGNPQLDTTDALNAALSDTPGSLEFLGGFKVSGNGESCLTMTKNISLRANKSRTTFIRADSAGTGTSLLKIAISSDGNGGLLDIRDLSLSNLTMFHNLGGSHVVLIKDTIPIIGMSLIGLNLSAGNAGRTLYMDSEDVGFSVIERCVFGNGVTWGTPANQAPDGSKFNNCTFFGQDTGFIANITSGAYCTEINGGTMVNRDGAIRIITGSQIRVRGVQIEHAQGQGVSQSAEKAHIAILGTGELSKDIIIEECNFGGGTNLDYLIWADNCLDLDVTKCIGNAPAVADAFLTGNCQYAKIRRDNKFRGNISNPRDNSAIFRASIIDNGYGTYNVLKNQPALVNGWLGGQFYKEENDDIVINTGFNAGTNTSGTIMATLPDGFKPADFYSIPVATSGSVGSIDVRPTGEILIKTPGTNSSVASQVRFKSRRT